jgi:hypothetical protein
LLRSVGTGWTGQASDAAGKAFGQLMQTSNANADSASMVGMKIAFAQRSSDETLRILGPVLAAATSGPLPTLPLPGLNGKPLLMGAPVIPGAQSPIPILAATQSRASQQEEAKQACQQVLQNIYAPGLHGGDQGVPVLPSVQQIANPVGPAQPGPSQPGPSAPGPVTPGGGTQPSPGSGTPGNQPGDQQPGQGDGQPQSPSAQDPGSSKTDSAGYNPGQSGVPGLGAASPTSTAGVGADGNPSAGGLGGPGFGGLGGGGLGGDTSRFGGRGSSVPGKPLPSAASAAAAGPGRAGAPGAPGMSPGGMGQGAHGKGEKDQEHKSSGLLHGQYLEDWLDDGQRVLPAFGAIGENPPEAPRDQPPSAPPGRGGVSGEYR